jgi:hypothetical protein
MGQLTLPFSVGCISDVQSASGLSDFLVRDQRAIALAKAAAFSYLDYTACVTTTLQHAVGSLGGRRSLALRSGRRASVAGLVRQELLGTFPMR